MAARPAPDTIGKYRVLDRLGRGGMGTVLKAHDPVLDRVVALKVISADIEVTDELRARFFREAQAGARLSHPNIVTVYDLTEAEGRLVIVMEFLDGEELRQVIAQRRPLGLEEKLAIMIQVCDGLGYAHQHRIVHRDIKPGNIFVLRDGSAKLLDFGVARIVTEEAGLTRTGLIMGTLRYIAPEQARGRADHRSDIFSVGAVFYELVGYRPAFPGDDPMEILEALRSHEPPLLNEVDASVPAELALLIARAMHKDAEQRVQDLADMRQELDAIRRRVLATVDAARQRVRARIGDVRQLQAAVAEQLGSGVDEETMPTPAAGGLALLAAMEQNAANRIARLTALLEAAARHQPAFAHGGSLLAAGRVEDAIAVLEPVVRDLPEHQRARAALAEARDRLEQERRKAREQAAARARGSRDTMDLERASAREAEAPFLAAEAWQAAQARSAGGEAALAQQDYARAVELLDDAREQYRQAAALAGETRRQRARDEADAARREAVRAREAAAQDDAERQAPTAWQAAAQSEALAGDALGRQAFAAAAASFQQAREAYEQAASLARQERAHQAGQAAERARAEADRLRQVAQHADAAVHAAPSWTAAAQARGDGEALLGQGAYTEATVRFTSAAALYTSAADEAGAVVRRQRQTAAEAAQARADARRRRAEQAGAGHRDDAAWATAEQAVARGRGAADLGDFVEAAAAYERAAEGFGEAEAAALELAHRAEAEQADATRLAALPSSAGERPVLADVDRTISAGLSPAERALEPARSESAILERQAPAPLLGHRTTDVRPRAMVAATVAVGMIALGAGGWWLLRRQPASEPAAKVAPAAPSFEAVSALGQRVADARRTADGVGAAQLASETYQSAVQAEARAVAALGQRELGPAERQFSQALTLFTTANSAARQRQDAEIADLRARIAAARQAAEQAGAGVSASAPLKAAQVREREAEAALGRADLRAAAAALRDAEGQYKLALQTVAKELQDVAKELPPKPDTTEPEQRKRLDAARETAAGARAAAARSEAALVARDAFEPATRRWNQAEADAASGNMSAAIQSFSDAGRMYQDATRRARERQALRREAEAARERARTAGADLLARDVFETGSARLAEAERMVQSQDWSGAGRTYADAAARYAEAERLVRNRNAVRIEAEKTKERREQARLAGAEVVAKPFFDKAAARHVEADRLANGSDVLAAIPVYREAAQLYADAEKGARELKRN